MKTTFKLLPLLVFAISTVYAAPLGRGGNFGLGIILGEPTGLTAKIWNNSVSAYDLGLSFSLSDYVLVYGDYLHHFRGVLGNSSTFVTQLTPYVGIGGVLILSNNGNRDGTYFKNRGTDSLGLGVRIPLGVEWKASDIPLGVFIELVPGIGLIPSTYSFVQGGVGARYYF